MGTPNETLFVLDQPVGEGRRYPHDCSNKGDNSLIITRTRKGWIWYCHRCNEWGIRDLSGKTPAEKAAFIKSLDVKPVEQVGTVMLPHDFTKDLSPEGFVYLYSRGITNGDIKRWRIGYSARYDRVIFPVYWGQALVCYTGRTMRPITRTNPKFMKVVKAGTKNPYFVVNNLVSKDVVIVEDIVSAIRVGKIADTFALLSTHVPDTLILRLDEMYERICIWLDPDKRGKSIELFRRYVSFGMNVNVILSQKDPKYYSDEEIRGYVYG